MKEEMCPQSYHANWNETVEYSESQGVIYANLLADLLREQRPVAEVDVYHGYPVAEIVVSDDHKCKLSVRLKSPETRSYSDTSVTVTGVTFVTQEGMRTGNVVIRIVGGYQSPLKSCDFQIGQISNGDFNEVPVNYDGMSQESLKHIIHKSVEERQYRCAPTAREIIAAVDTDYEVFAVCDDIVYAYDDEDEVPDGFERMSYEDAVQALYDEWFENGSVIEK